MFLGDLGIAVASSFFRLLQPEWADWSELDFFRTVPCQTLLSAFPKALTFLYPPSIFLSHPWRSFHYSSAASTTTFPSLPIASYTSATPAVVSTRPSSSADFSSTPPAADRVLTSFADWHRTAQTFTYKLPRFAFASGHFAPWARATPSTLAAASSYLVASFYCGSQCCSSAHWHTPASSFSPSPLPFTPQSRLTRIFAERDFSQALSTII